MLFILLLLFLCFRRDIEGNIVAIQCANQTRDSYMKQPVDQVEPMIRALRKLDDILYENHIRIKMEEGLYFSMSLTLPIIKGIWYLFRIRVFKQVSVTYLIRQSQVLILQVSFISWIFVSYIHA